MYKTLHKKQGSVTVQLRFARSSVTFCAKRDKIYANLENGNVVLMPSISEVSQIWTPAQTFFTDLAKDAFRSGSEKKYQDLPALKSGLEQMDTQIHDAIYTLK